MLAFAGVIEYWDASSHEFPSDVVAFDSKLDTDLYALAKAKTTAASLDVSRDGAQFAMFCADRCTPTLSCQHCGLQVAKSVASPNAVQVCILRISRSSSCCRSLLPLIELQEGTGLQLCQRQTAAQLR
jgi:hypothetical protein